jgi:hypothetical protein
LKAWPVTDEGLRLYTTGNGGEEKIGLHTNQEIELELTGTGVDSSTVIWTSDKSVTGLTAGPAIAGSIAVKVKSLGKAGKVTLIANDGTGKQIAGPLHVVVGDFKYHPGMAIDLIAKVCRGNDSLKIHALQRMLNDNPDNVFAQGDQSNFHAKYGGWACGIVAKYRGYEVFGHLEEVMYSKPYHEPLRSRITKRSQVIYDPGVIWALTSRIGSSLINGLPARVGVLDRPDVMTPQNGKLISYLAGGHTVLIVGCDDTLTKFLYIDPWYNGSKMKYEGGIAGNEFRVESQSIGILEVTHDANRRIKPGDTSANIIQQSRKTEGTFKFINDNFLEVVAGPWHLKEWKN